ncbi:hypothetical protein HN748_01675 [Candidatus Peregrinibacteria bacterium]|nr:hypothetical protein [Candidatus Peregrinibacteria bacterium]MBT7484007.1 hypothetical protein [Candidatus Peregrinibacteria bacterium]MBT7702921.1 hypothetical protein [Candidatus Peregrinibacteria bacterium]
MRAFWFNDCMIEDNNASSIIDAAEQFDILEILNRGIAYAIIIAGFLSVVFIFLGGISFILSGGQEDKIKQAVSTIRYAIIGLIVTVMAIVIVGLVGRALGLDIIQYLNPSDIFETVRELTSQAGDSGNSGIERLE